MAVTKKRASKSPALSHSEIVRLWGDVEVVDATKDLRVFVQPEDVASATAKDPGNCVFAQACKRQFQATRVIFWKTTAYVDLPGPAGKRRVERFLVSPQMRSLIENFDKGNVVPDMAGFELKRPRESETFAKKAERTAKSYRERKKALINGARRGNQGKGAYSKPARVIDLEVRSGIGRVQFKRHEA
jgi:hypothetical protein